MTESPMGPVGGEPVPPRPDESQRPDGEGIRFRDNRRIDPTTYAPRVPPPSAPGPAGQPAGEAAPDAMPEVLDDAAQKVSELTADLQRLSAEYANYRKRVDRDRDLQRELAVAMVMSDLLPVLDDIGRAREHGELDGGFKAVAEAVETLAAKYGVAAYGAVGDPFDPNVHEAMTAQTSPEATGPTVSAVYQVGFRVGERVVRPARVGVVDAE